jgi:hypothetical protein
MQYRTLVRAWIGQHPFRAALGGTDDFWVTRSFARFWYVIHPPRIGAFHGLTELLRYLKLCVHSVMLDEQRARHAIRDKPIREDVGNAGGVSAEHLWATIQADLKDGDERLVAYLCLVLAMKPEEVQSHAPERFGSVAEVRAVKDTLLDRLRHNPRMCQL